MAKRSELPKTPSVTIPLKSMWTDDKIVLPNGDKARIVNQEFIDRDVTVKRRVSILTCEIMSGPQKGFFVTTTAMDSDDVDIYPRSELPLMERIRRWWNRPNYSIV